jgi:hypothetical protein
MNYYPISGLSKLKSLRGWNALCAPINGHIIKKNQEALTGTYCLLSLLYKLSVRYDNYRGCSVGVTDERDLLGKPTEMASGGNICIPSFMMISSGI